MYLFSLRWLRAQIKSSLLVLIGIILPLLLSACAEQSEVFELGVYIDRPNLMPRLEGLKDGLAALGYREGQSIRYHLLDSSKLSAEQLEPALKEFAAKNYSAYWTISMTAAQPLQKYLSGRQPIISSGLSDPVQIGLIQSLDHPGANLTGVASRANELTATRLRWLVSFDPAIRHIYLIYDSTNPAQLIHLVEVKEEALRLGVVLLERPLASKEEAKKVILGFTHQEAQAILPMGIVPFSLAQAELKIVVLREKLVMVGGGLSNLEDGALFSYASDEFGIGRQSSTLVDQVLHKEDPAQLAILFPDKIELILNQKLATQLGKVFPERFVANADQIVK